MYRWALARERAQNAWAQVRTQRKQAYAIALAYAREMTAADQGDLRGLKAWQEIYFDAEPDYSGTWEWTVAEGPKENAYVAF